MLASRPRFGDPAGNWDKLEIFPHDAMATIYHKTTKGQIEIESRRYRLLPRLRTALILVDGRRSDDELAKLIPGESVAALKALLDDGFIEVSALVEQRIAPRPAAPAPAPAPAPVAPKPEAAVTSRPARSPEFEQRKRDAVHSLTDQVGPMAEALAIRIEKCADWNQLLAALQVAQQVVRNTRGAAAAATFGARFIDTPLT